MNSADVSSKSSSSALVPDVGFIAFFIGQGLIVVHLKTCCPLPWGAVQHKKVTATAFREDRALPYVLMNMG